MILAVEGRITKLQMYSEMVHSPVVPLTEGKINEIFPKSTEWGLGVCLLFGSACNAADYKLDDRLSGPNQEIALYFSLYWHLRQKQYPILANYHVSILSASSNGHDANCPNNVAGAYGYSQLPVGLIDKYNQALLTHRRALVDATELQNSLNVNSDQEAHREVQVPTLLINK